MCTPFNFTVRNYVKRYIIERPLITRSIEHLIHGLMRQFNAEAVLLQHESASDPSWEKKMVNKNTYKVAALAGTALANAGPKPGKKALNPPLA